MQWNHTQAKIGDAGEVHVPLLASTISHNSSSLFYSSFILVLGEGNSTPLQYSCLENPMDEGAWWAAVHGVTKSRAQLSDPFLFTFMHWQRRWQATCVLAWSIPGMREPGGLLSMGSHRVGDDWSDAAAAAASQYLFLDPPSPNV